MASRIYIYAGINPDAFFDETMCQTACPAKKIYRRYNQGFFEFFVHYSLHFESDEFNDFL
jgi:hypothetical protein